MRHSSSTSVLRWHIPLICILGGVLVTVSSRGDVGPTTKQSFRDQLTKGALKSWEEAHANRQEAVAAALAVLSEGEREVRQDDLATFERNQRMYCAIQLLGQYRASESIDILLQRITFQPMISRGSTDSALVPHRFPAVEALINIGLPSTKAFIQSLAKPHSDEELQFFALVVANVDAENELAVQRLRLAEKRAAPIDREHQRNFARLIELVQQVQLP